MTKVVSDLHLEFYKNINEFNRKVFHKFGNGKYLILPGDICTAHNSNGKINQLFIDFLDLAKTKFQEVIFCAGNHEFYKSDTNYEKTIEYLEDISKLTNTIFLNRNSVVLDGVEYIGCTLWSDIRNVDFNKIRINDFYHKNVFKKQDDYISKHLEDVEWLKSLDLSSSHPKIIITHHLPSSKLCHPRFKFSEYERYFYTPEIAEEILENAVNVKYWLCGHTHENVSCIIKNTHVMANPVGYPGEYRETKYFTNELS